MSRQIYNCIHIYVNIVNILYIQRINQKRNANQYCYNIPPHHNKNIIKWPKTLSGRPWKNSTFSAMVYMQIITPVMENSKVFLKIKKSIAICPEIPLLHMFSKEIKAIHHITEWNLSFHNSQEMTETNVSINRRMDKDNSAQRYHRILYNHKTWTFVIFKIINGTISHQMKT